MSVEQGRRWKIRPEGSNWGDFGDDDEIGRLNLITPERVMAAAREIREGLSFCLSLPLDLPGGGRGSRQPPKLFATGEPDQPRMNHWMTEYPGISDVLCDDGVVLTLQYSTQWDGLCHVGHRFDADGDGVDEPVYYNGWRAGVDVKGHDEGGARRLGIQTYAEKGMQTRGVMFDFRRHFGPERRAVSYDDLMRVIDADGIEIAPGDIMCLHSGFGEALVRMAGNPDPKVLRTLGAELDGGDARLLQWVIDSGVAAIAADTAAVETFRRPTEPGPKLKPLLPLHELCLFKLGVPLGEYWWLTPLAEALAERRRSAFMLTAPPLRLPGAVGSPVTPIATI
jgi:kynurenine formamidase